MLSALKKKTKQVSYESASFLFAQSIHLRFKGQHIINHRANRFPLWHLFHSLVVDQHRGGDYQIPPEINDHLLQTFMFMNEDPHRSIKSVTAGPRSVPLLLRREIIKELSANFTMWCTGWWRQHSQVYSQNNRGERTEPWGAPVEERRASDWTIPTLSQCNVSVKKSISQHIKPWPTRVGVPQSLCKNMWLDAFKSRSKIKENKLRKDHVQ